MDKSDTAVACPYVVMLKIGIMFYYARIIRIIQKNGVKGLEIKPKDVEQCKNADEEERGAVKEMANDANNHFDNDNDHYTNKQLIG